MKRSSRIGRLMMAALMIVLALSAGLSTAFAGPADEGYKTRGDLMKAYKARQEYQAAIQERMVKADAYDAAVVAVIADLRAKGAETARLDEGLANFRYRMSSIRNEWQEADALLTAHPGFDANGIVLDKDTARETIYKVRHCQRMIVEIGSNIYTQMHNAFLDYGKKHPNLDVVEPARPTQRSLIS